MIEFGILAALGAMLCWGFGDFLIQKTTRRIGDIEALAVIGIIGSLGLFPLVFAEISLLSFPAMLLMLILGVLTFVVGAIDFEALKQGKLSVIDVMLEIELPFTMILAFILFQETVSVMQGVLISIIFVGAVLLALGNLSWKAKMEKGALLALIAAVGMAGVNFLTAAGSRLASPVMAIWLPAVIFTVLSLVIIVQREGCKAFMRQAGKYKTLAIVMGIIDTLAWVLYAFSTVDNKIAIATAITESYPAIALMLGVAFNNEKIVPHQVLGGLMALVASISLAFI